MSQSGVPALPELQHWGCAHCPGAGSCPPPSGTEPFPDLPWPSADAAPRCSLRSLLANLFILLYSSRASVHTRSGQYFSYFSLQIQRARKSCAELSSVRGGSRFQRNLAPFIAISIGLVPRCTALLCWLFTPHGIQLAIPLLV